MFKWVRKVVREVIDNTIKDDINFDKDIYTFVTRKNTPRSVFQVTLLICGFIYYLLMLWMMKFYTDLNSQILYILFLGFVAVITLYYSFEWQGIITFYLKGIWYRITMVFLIINLLYITAVFLFKVINATEYQYFIVVIFIFLLKDLMLIPLTQLKHKNIPRLVSGLLFFYTLFDLFVFIVVTMVILVFVSFFFNDKIFPQLYQAVGGSSALLLIVYVAFLYAGAEIVKSHTIDSLEKYIKNP